MDVERAKRYKDKLGLISERLWDIDEWTSEYDVSKFVSDKKTRLAVYEAFQELTEASFDIVAMVCRDSKIITKDDYTNVDSLYNKKFIDDNTKTALSESNGLRNRLIHRYNNLDDSIAFESIQALLSDFAYFSEVVNKWLKSQL
ncbi:MAG: DUF86 domain-containing protein [Candidatus Methanoperedens sp.]|nr:DUF86 domain-containing protein [Candidatus Methanoperedens sp.]